MKKITFMLGLFASIVCQHAMAQFTQIGTTPNLVTPDNIGIGLPVAAVPDAKLKIYANANVSGGAMWNPFNSPAPTPLPCTLLGRPAISINWEPLNDNGGAISLFQRLCSNTIVNPNAFEIYGIQSSQGQSGNNTTTSYALYVDPVGQTGIGSSVKPGFGLTVGNHSLFKKMLL